MNVGYEEVLHAIELVRELLKHVEKLSDKERRFIEQTAGRFDQYGDGTLLSPAQFAWIKSLAKKHLRVTV